MAASIWQSRKDSKNCKTLSADTNQRPTTPNQTSVKLLAYRTPLFSLLPPVSQNDEDFDLSMWTEAYKSAKNFIMARQKERFYLRGCSEKDLKKVALLKGCKTRGEIAIQIGRQQNSGKARSQSDTFIHKVKGNVVSYDIYGIPAGIHPSEKRPPKPFTRYHQQSKGGEKPVKYRFEKLQPWVEKDSCKGSGGEFSLAINDGKGCSVTVKGREHDQATVGTGYIGGKGCSVTVKGREHDQAAVGTGYIGGQGCGVKGREHDHAAVGTGYIGAIAIFLPHHR